MKPRVLVVDDEPRLGESLVTALERSGYNCGVCVSGEDALRFVAEHGVDLVVTDLRMPGMDGLELMRRLRQDLPELPILLMTAYGDVRSAVEAMRAGAFDYVTKPFDHEELRELVARALELVRLKSENRQLREEVGARFHRSLVAESPAMLEVLALVDRAGPSSATVLIQGESGTGKEVVAKRLHYTSPRVGRPFLAVNCKAFAAGVLESELFGHEKGAFTGAESRRLGCFERASGGTLFLDEIGEVDTAFQAKLLRVLQEGEVLPVGAEAPRPVDVRVVAATNRDLRQEIAAGRFREDLFYRLNVIPVLLPPLRQRPEDVLPLARFFLRRQEESGGLPRSLSSAAESALRTHAWPGNVRELENVVERAVVLARGEVIGPEDLLLEASAPGAAEGVLDTGQGTLQEGIDRWTEERIRRALAHHGGKRAAAARELGIDRTTLFRLMKKLEI